MKYKSKNPFPHLILPFTHPFPLAWNAPPRCLKPLLPPPLPLARNCPYPTPFFALKIEGCFIDFSLSFLVLNTRKVQYQFSDEQDATRTKFKSQFQKEITTYVRFFCVWLGVCRLNWIRDKGEGKKGESREAYGRDFYERGRGLREVGKWAGQGGERTWII